MSNFKDLVRLGKDAVTRFTQGGKPVTGFSAAFDNGYGERKQTVWLDCSLWGERGEKLAPSLLKGTLVLVEGDLGTREHEGKTYLTLDVRDLKFTGKAEKGEGERPQRASRPAANAKPAGEFVDDDLTDVPF